MKSFKQFVAADDVFIDRVPWRGDFAQEIFNRLHRADIKSLRGLYTWCRQRYPDFYRDYRLVQDAKNGKEMMAQLWGFYLAWAEGVPK